MRHFANRGSRRRSRRAADAAPSFDESPETFFQPTGRGRRDHKTAQLCRQVFRALTLALGECADDVLRELVVVDVRPAPDASRMLVRVACSAPVGGAVGMADVLARLDEAGGFFRREVAAAITRKRAPELTFVLVPPGGEGAR